MKNATFIPKHQIQNSCPIGSDLPIQDGYIYPDNKTGAFSKKHHKMEDTHGFEQTDDRLLHRP